MRVAAVLLLLVLLAPVAAADHVFSHRVYVVGRVVDADGRPAAGAPVTLAFENLSAGGRCFDAKPEMTGPRGDFEICRHTHAIPDNATVTVRVGDASARVGVDPDLRHAVANLQLGTSDVAHDVGGERIFGRTLLVTGRHFALLGRPENVEGVVVNATPLGENVSARLLRDGEAIASASTTVDEHGRYQLDLNVTEIPAGALVEVVSGQDRTEESVSTVFRRADVNLLRDLRLIAGPGEDAPGSQTPLSPLLALAALIGVASWRARPRR